MANMIPTREETYKVHTLLSESRQADLKAEATKLLEEAFALHKVNGRLPHLQNVPSVLMDSIEDLLSERGWIRARDYTMGPQKGREYCLEVLFLEPRMSP